MTERVNKYKKFIEEKSQTQHGIGTALKSTVSEAKELLKKTWNKIGIQKGIFSQKKI